MEEALREPGRPRFRFAAPPGIHVSSFRPALGQVLADLREQSVSDRELAVPRES